MHICNKKKGTKLKRTPHSYPNIHNNKHPILKHEHRHLRFKRFFSMNFFFIKSLKHLVPVDMKSLKSAAKTQHHD